MLSPEESVALLAALRASSLYRDDQQSYLLYPEKALAAFMEMNRVPDSILLRTPTLAARVSAGDDRILVRDVEGQLRFNADLENVAALARRLDEARPDVLPDAERTALLDAYEAVFDHKSFTGRSGTMYRYEGIGCIYWHMVAKLALASQEVAQQAATAGADPATVAALRRHYGEIRSGLGFRKSPAAFGAFPLDPYSHTPAFGGASQPGMTGQVKEEILARWGELGLRVENGALVLDPSQVDEAEFLPADGTLVWMDAESVRQSLPLERGDLAFTFCQVPVVYKAAMESVIVVRSRDGSEQHLTGTVVPAAIALRVFARTGDIVRITVHFPARDRGSH
jgi:hypothetical protein